MATIVVHSQTSPVQDAEALRLAFKGESYLHIFALLIYLMMLDYN